jgi:Pentapeptide repeats (8 copies)
LAAAVLVAAKLTGATCFYADLSLADLSSAVAFATSFERASLFAARLNRAEAMDANFEFSDLRNAVLISCNFERASFVGASLQGAKAVDCNFKDADFYWAELQGFTHHNCDFTGVRWPEEVKIAYGPRGVTPPNVTPVPLYRKAATEEERKKLLESYLEISPEQR